MPTKLIFPGPTAAHVSKMPWRALITLLVAGMLVLAGCGPAAATPTPVPAAATAAAEAGFEALIPLARTFVDQLAQGDFTAASSRFDAAMKTAMPTAKLKETWQQLLLQAGAFQKQLEAQTLEQKGYKIVLVTCQFEKAMLAVQVTFDAQQRIVGMFFKPVQASVPTAMPSNTNVTEAQALVDRLAKGDFAGAIRSFDEKMKSVVNEAMLKESWAQITGQMGAFQARGATRSGSVQGLPAVYVTCQFTNGPLDMEVLFNPQGQVTGMHFVPTQPEGAAAPTYAAPAYVNSTAFKESEVTVGSGTWALPGTLTLPNGAGPFPAVVLVHGSGPNDRNETIGPNQPFRDLAWGLSSQGIAVLRYDKRTLVHKQKFSPEVVAQLTLKEETIEDALLAAQLLRQTPGIDPKRVFVLGHSLGATAAPRIGQQDPALAGLIVMAGMNIPFEDEILRQVIYLNGSSPSDAQKAQIEILKAQVARVKDPALSVQTAAADLPLGIAPAYWLDLRGYVPAEVAKNLAMPVFVLQGERDYQVTPELDFKGWQTALAGKANAQLKLYLGLNHLFMMGTGQPNPQEYNTAGHVSEEVVKDIAQWVLKN